ncbi:MAG TPA: hypothetical protein VNS29_04080 [Burkholderiaceae bacterium]|nr:hypothetical protein [Burkholderiaceae bacterium]
MATVHLKGPGLNDWFAEQIVKDHGAEEALNRTCGPARQAVLRVIESRGLEVNQSKVEQE